MATQLLRVTPAQLAQAATRLNGQIQQYNSAYNKIYTEVTTLRGTWSGEANQKFSQQLEGFRDDFIALENLLKQYEQFIRDSARNYDTTEQRLVQDANALPTGR
jgi:WXG100 family type VII secretion target